MRIVFALLIALSSVAYAGYTPPDSTTTPPDSLDTGGGPGGNMLLDVVRHAGTVGERIAIMLVADTTALYERLVLYGVTPEEATALSTIDEPYPPFTLPTSVSESVVPASLADVKRAFR